MDDQPQNLQSETERRERGGLVLAVLALGLPVALYNLALIERKFSLLTGSGFLQRHPLGWAEALAFPILFLVQVLLLLLTASAVLRWTLCKLTRRSGWTRTAVAASTLAYFLAVTAQFEVYRRFKDGIDLALARDLGGGDWKTVLSYVREELVGLLPLLVAAAVAAVAGVWALKRYGAGLAVRLGGTAWARRCTSRRGLVALNLLLVAVPLLLLVSDPLERALSHSMAHRAYRLPGAYLTDLDRDGYGLLVRPACAIARL